MSQLLDLKNSSNSEHLASTLFEYLKDNNHEKRSEAISFLNYYDDNIIIKSNSLAQTLISSKQTEKEFNENKDILKEYHKDRAKYLNTFHSLLLKLEKELKTNSVLEEDHKKLLSSCFTLIHHKYIILKENHSEFKNFLNDLNNFKPTFKTENIKTIRDRYNKVVNGIKNTFK